MFVVFVSASISAGNILTFSDTPVYSNSSNIDVLVSLDDNTENITAIFII
jgi:hypothetical protein